MNIQYSENKITAEAVLKWEEETKKGFLVTIFSVFAQVCRKNYASNNRVPVFAMNLGKKW